jgi:NHL repeat
MRASLYRLQLKKSIRNYIYEENERVNYPLIYKRKQNAYYINMNKRLILLLSVLTVFMAYPLSAQEDFRSRIVIVPMKNGTELDQYNPLCSTITDTVSLVLEFLKDYKVLGEEEVNIARLQRIDPSDREAVKQAALEEGIDEIVYGNMVQVDDVFQFTISLYNVKKARVTNTERAEAFSVLEVFDAGDELTAGLIAQLSDITIAFGSIKLVQKGGKGNYTVNLDSYPLRNPDKTFKKVLNGQYEISISQKRLTGVETVFKEFIEVSEGQESIVDFTIPPADSEEFQWMEEQGDALLSLGQDKENFDQFMEELTAFQNKTLAIEYDRDLESERQNYLDQAGDLATATLQGRIEEADMSFYSKRVNFDESLQNYESILSLVKTDYDVKLLKGSNELFFSEPQKIQLGGGDLVYFTAFDSDNANFLYQWNPEDNSIRFRALEGNTEEYYRGDFYTSGWKLYLLEPESKDIKILDDTLETIDILPIPDFIDEDNKVKMSISESGFIYLVSADQIRVIDSAREYDESGELQLPDRYYSIEDNLREALSSETNSPGDVFFDKAGHLNIYYPEIGTLYISDAKGVLLKRLKLSLSRSESRIAVDETGIIYITLYSDNSVAKYTAAGELITTFGHYGTDPDQFSLPTGIVIAKGGKIYIADSYNSRIKILDPLNPPVIYPEIAQYSTDLDRRIDRSLVGVKKDSAARAEVNWKTHTGNAIATSALLGSAFGLIVLQDYAANNEAIAYVGYQNSIDPDEIIDFKKSADLNKALRISSEVGAITVFGMASAWGTETALNIVLDTTFTGYNRRQIQRLDMNEIYEIGTDKYRSIRASSRIGIWTGIVPPVLGLIGAVASPFLQNPASEDLLKYSVIGGIFSPPIFSHLHGGRFNLGLLIAGLSADVLAIWGLSEMEALISDDYEPWGPDRYDLDNPDSISMSRIFERLGETKGLYILSAAFGIRLAAGIFDTRYGWTYTNNYNRYKAVKPKDSEETASADFDVNPYLNNRGGLGLALKVSF